MNVDAELRNIAARYAEWLPAVLIATVQASIDDDLPPPDFQLPDTSGRGLIPTRLAICALRFLHA